MQISTRLFNAQSIDRFSDLNEAIQNTQTKIATGKSTLNASEDPIAAAAISASRDQQSMLTRFQDNIVHARMKLTVAETAMAQIVNAATRVYELAVQAGNDTLSEADMAAMAAEVKQIKSFMLGLANTRDVHGQAVFAGFRTGDPPFVEDSNGTVSYQGDRGQHMLQVSESYSIRTGLDGGEVFQRIPGETGPEDMFAIISDLENGLTANNVPTNIIGRLDSAVEHISIQQAVIGSAINQADEQAAVLEKRKLVVTENLSSLEDADLHELVLNLQSLLTSRDAAQQAFAKIGQQSLFDFLR